MSLLVVGDGLWLRRAHLSIYLTLDRLLFGLRELQSYSSHRHALADLLPSTLVQRKPQAETDFEPGRKMCNRHKNKKKKKKVDLDATGTSSNITTTTDPTTGLPNLSTVPQLLTSLRAASDLDGVHKYEAACRITDLPGQEHVELELKLPYTVVGESRPAPELNAAESMRRARARARPLIELIHQATGYSFV